MKPSIGNNGEFCVCVKPHSSFERDEHEVTEDDFAHFNSVYTEVHIYIFPVPLTMYTVVPVYHSQEPIGGSSLIRPHHFFTTFMYHKYSENVCIGMTSSVLAKPVDTDLAFELPTVFKMKRNVKNTDLSVSIVCMDGREFNALMALGVCECMYWPHILRDFAFKI